MEDASYDLEKGKSYISLGNTHLTGTLILGVYAGPSNGKFFAWESQQYGWLRLQLREFCVLILYSFLLAPATGWGLLSHVVSAENEITEGFNQDQCINLFKSQCYKFREKYVDVVMRYDELKEFRDTVSRIGFVRELDSANSILTALKLAQQQK